MVTLRKSLSVPLDQYGKFICLPGETILLATRTHMYTVFLRVGFSGLLFALIATGIAYGVIAHSLPLGFAFLLLLAIGSLFAAVSLIAYASWYYHFYIVTNRKILEVKSIPYLSYSANDVLLDQVRCTEIDIKREGLLHMFLNVGNIILTFDRPTHQEAFTLYDLHDPENIGIFLGDMLETRKAEQNMIWTKLNNQKRYLITDDITPSSGLLQG